MYGLGELNPLSGEPLKVGQEVVRGPSFTGPRLTVVWTAQPSTWPRWIESVNGRPVDRGTIPGGTWDGYTSLPDIEVTAPLVRWPVLALLAAMGILASTGGK